LTPANERTDAVEPILVTGATGKLGRQVVHALLERERAIRIASRRPRPTGARPKEWATVSYGEPASLDRALAGVTAIVHCAWSYRGGVDRAVIEAARRVDVPHIVYISIVGADRIPLGFYRRKLAAERLLEDSGRPFTILRVTQFHDLLWVAFGALARLPVILIPASTSFQPIDVRDVGSRLAELALQPPVGRAPDMGGPEVETAVELALTYLRVTGRRRGLRAFRIPGGIGAALRAGSNLAPSSRSGRITFEEFATQRLAGVENAGDGSPRDDRGPRGGRRDAH